MMRLDLSALDSHARHRILEHFQVSLESGDAAQPFCQAVAAALRDGVATFPEPETAAAARVWKVIAANFYKALFETGPADSGSRQAALAFHSLAADLDDQERRLDEAAHLGSEARLKYGLPSGIGEILPEDEGPQR